MTGSKSEQPLRLIGWGGIIAAIIFFFNPDVGVIDILPDFIGYFFLCAAIKKAADIDDRINEARELFRRMLYASLVGFFSIFVLFGFIPSTDQSVSMLMFAFILSVFEIVTVVPAVIKLFDGILYLSARHGGEAAFAPARKNGGSVYQKNITEKIRNMTVAFIIIKASCRTLPEFASLTEQTYNESAVGQLYLYKDLLRDFGIIIAVIAAIIWIIKMLRYVAAIKRDVRLFESLGVLYKENVLTHKDIFARRAVKAAFGYFGAGALLTIDFYVDNFNILPDFLSALCVTAGLLIIRKYIRGWRTGVAAAGIYGLLSLGTGIYEYWFNTNFYPEAIMRDEATYDAFVRLCGFTAATEAVFLVFIAVLLFIVIRNIILQHTGFSMTSNDSYNPSEKIRLLHASLTRRMIAPAAFAVLAAASQVAAVLLVNTVDFMWMIEFLLSGLFAFYFIKLLMEINEQISYKYMLS
jgi:hypothetical protein